MLSVLKQLEGADRAARQEARLEIKMERSTGTRSSQRAFYRFCEEVNTGRHPRLSKFGHDFVLPPLDRSPRSLGERLATMDRCDACPGATEGAKDAWRHFEFERAMR